jgi:acetyltransferase-like isoleucine patch superfamily enzyme
LSRTAGKQLDPGRPDAATKPWRASPDHLRDPWGSSVKLLHWLNACWHFRRRSRIGAYTRLVGKAHVVVRRDALVVMGEHVLVMSTFARSVFVAFPGARLEIGDRTFLNYGLDVAATKLVRIGADCLIGTHVTIMDNQFHGILARHEMPSGQPVVIGDGVWIGNRAIIMPGVTIGARAVVGAGSVVTRDVAAGAVVAGNPARMLRQLDEAPGIGDPT